MQLRHGLLTACTTALCVALASAALSARSTQRAPLLSDGLSGELEQAAEKISLNAQVTQRLTALLYQHMVGHTGNLRADALDAFMAVDATPLVRQALLVRDSPGLVVGAAEYMAGKQDAESLPSLVYALEQANFLQPGSEDAMLHGALQWELVSAIGAITGLSGDAEAILPTHRGRQIGYEAIGKFIGRVRLWALQSGTELWPPAEPIRWGPEPPLEVEDRINNLVKRAQSDEDQAVRKWARDRLIKLRSRIDAGLEEPAPTRAPQEPDTQER